MKNAWVSRVGMVTLVGVLVLAGDAYAEKEKQTPAPVAVPRVVDANNKLVGQVVGASDGNFLGQPVNAVVALNIPNTSLVAVVTSDHLYGNARVYFDQPNCVGQPYFYIQGAISQPHLLPIVGVANGILYGPRANGTPVVIAFSSFVELDNICKPASLSGGIIADPIIDLSTLFTPPYRFVYP